MTGLQQSKTRPRLNGALAVAALAASILLAARSAFSQEDVPQEYQLKAAFFYKIASYIEWPPTTARPAPPPIRFCIYGRDPFQKVIDRIAAINDPTGRASDIRRLSKLEGLDQCHYLYIGEPDQNAIRKVLTACRGHSIVTVADSSQFIKIGGTVELYLENRKVYFRINQGAAQAENIRISSRLLVLAKEVLR